MQARTLREGGEVRLLRRPVEYYRWLQKRLSGVGRRLSHKIITSNNAITILWQPAAEPKVGVIRDLEVISSRRVNQWIVERNAPTGWVLRTVPDIIRFHYPAGDKDHRLAGPCKIGVQRCRGRGGPDYDAPEWAEIPYRSNLGAVSVVIVVATLRKIAVYIRGIGLAIDCLAGIDDYRRAVNCVPIRAAIPALDCPLIRIT